MTYKRFLTTAALERITPVRKKIDRSALHSLRPIHIVSSLDRRASLEFHATPFSTITFRSIIAPHSATALRLTLVPRHASPDQRASLHRCSTPHSVSLVRVSRFAQPSHCVSLNCTHARISIRVRPHCIFADQCCWPCWTFLLCYYFAFLSLFYARSCTRHGYCVTLSCSPEDRLNEPVWV